ncbi:Kelch repeat-containing protein [Streptomyces sp. NPDC059874]|uniref:Kelch repeat-containing protein n=1 Tax=Streptomyces sp. NPDC059874 TaxID=3346983 RepID=UPI00364B3BFF
MLLSAVAMLVGVLPAAAVNGTVWTTLPSMPTARYGPASAAAPCPPGQTGTCVYAVGGFTSAESGTLESYNRLTNAWSTLASLITPRHFLASAAAPCPAGQTGTCVYAVGGAIGSTPTTTVESYNPATNAWSTVTSMNVARLGHGAAAAPCPLGQTGTCVYAVGGNDPGSVEAYNPATNAWSTVSPIAPRGELAAAAAPCPRGQSGICVYAVGGFASGVTGRVESYNPATNAWSPVASLPTPRTLLAATATSCPPGQSGVCVYAVGGAVAGSAAVRTMESYNPATNAWTTLPSMPTARSALAAAAAQCPPGSTGNCVYAIGGSNGSTPVGALEALDPPEVRRGLE